ncbi:hypothetical protein B7494_g4719 [Chlorociboria aeruginascens]|nr:hypothetical protein B7494_g4719 [Chlorociboria aeruginascens]
MWSSSEFTRPGGSPRMDVASLLFLDVSGAFDNISNPRLIHNLRKRQVDLQTVMLIESFLKDRTTTLRLGADTYIDDIAILISSQTTEENCRTLKQVHAEYDWVERLGTPESRRAIGALIHKHRQGVPEEISPPFRGGFNVYLKMKFMDSGCAIIRFPDTGRIMFPEEKIRKEVAIIRLLNEKTNIPVPFILYHGMMAEIPLNLAKSSKVSEPKLDSGPFKLFCDDMRPANFLVDADFKIVAALDWEFTYVAPAEFAYNPPFWLLLDRPEYCPEGLSG